MKNKIIAIIIIVLVLIGLFYLLSVNKTIAPTIEPVVQNTILDDSLLKDLGSYSYLSPNKKFSFTIYALDKEYKCLYRVTDDKGQQYNIQKLLGFDKIYCNFETGHYSSFSRWLDDHRFVVGEDFQNAWVVDIDKETSNFYQPENNNLIFRLVNNSLEYWLFQDGFEGSYFLLDKHGNTILTIENSYSRPALYDPVNNGIVFIDNTFNNDGVSTQFDFLPLDTFVLKSILTTKPTAVRGMGCVLEEIRSVIKGEIILSIGCLTVGPEHIGQDGNIHIQLK